MSYNEALSSIVTNSYVDIAYFNTSWGVCCRGL